MSGESKSIKASVVKDYVNYKLKITSMIMKIIGTGENVLAKTNWRDGIKHQPVGCMGSVPTEYIVVH